MIIHKIIIILWAQDFRTVKYCYNDIQMINNNNNTWGKQASQGEENEKEAKVEMGQRDMW